MSQRIVVYTAIFGGYEGLIPQPSFPNVDYVCFSDTAMRSTTWRVERIKPEFDDPTRNARKLKALPHQTLLKPYDVSIWIDGNYLIVGDIEELVASSLAEHDVAVFDHNQTVSDPRGCVYEEFAAMVASGERTGRFKDDPEVMARQVERYRNEGYPANNGLIFTAAMLRRHNAPGVQRAMETWWSEMSNFSRRDQLSIDYALWKHGLKFKVIDGDLRNHRHFYMLSHHQKSYAGSLLRYRLRKLFGQVKHR